MARQIFLDRWAPPSNIHPIPTDTAHPDDPDGSAARYARELKSFYSAETLDPARPLFDLVLMGVGPTAIPPRCFPVIPPWRRAERSVVGVPGAHVEPFVPRVSLTLPVLGSCHEMLFEVAGADKRAILTRVFDGAGSAGEPRLQRGRYSLAARSGRAAGAFSWPMRTDETPCALVVMGVSGSGKSTIAEELAERLALDL